MVTEAAAISSPVRVRRASPFTGVVVALLVIALVAPFALSGFRVLQLTHIVIYAVAVLGLNLLTGFSGQISLGNGAFWALGSYTGVILLTYCGVPYWATPVASGGVCFILGYLFGRVATRLEGLYLALGTFALAIATPQILKLDAFEKWTGGSQGVVMSKPRSPIAALDDDQWLYLFCLVVAILLFTAAWNVVRGRTGRALSALRDHPIAAGTMGVDTVAYKSITFGVSAMYTGIAGGLSAIVTGFISPDSFPIFLSIQLLVGGVLGGIASIFGTLFGAAFIELVPDLAKSLSDSAPAVLYGILLIVCMKVMPGGVAGLAHRARSWLIGRASHRSVT